MGTCNRPYPFCVFITNVDKASPHARTRFGLGCLGPMRVHWRGSTNNGRT